MLAGNETYDVFISYSRADSCHAAKIDSMLRDKGLRPFFDRRNLDPGLPWVRALERAIGSAKSAIVLIGPSGFGNTQQYERELAIIRRTREPEFRVIPVILPKNSSDLPFDFIQNLTWIDFSQVEKLSDSPDELERLLKAIQGGLPADEAARQAICPWRGLDAFRETPPFSSAAAAWTNRRALSPSYCARCASIRSSWWSADQGAASLHWFLPACYRRFGASVISSGLCYRSGRALNRSKRSLRCSIQSRLAKGR
jgi:hypothetical protein